MATGGSSADSEVVPRSGLRLPAPVGRHLVGLALADAIVDGSIGAGGAVRPGFPGGVG